MNSEFNNWPMHTQEEVDVVQSVLISNKTNYWTGQECRKFEREFAKFFDSKYAVALGNGTLALDVALKALKIGPGDEMIVTSRTFVASVSSIINVGATPVFADVSPSSQNITYDSIREKISNKTKAILCVHLGGWPCEMDLIMQLAEEQNLLVIEDCSQAHGAKFKGQSVGSFGHIGTWSFCQDKIMTTGGEGGMVTTNDESLWRNIWAYKDHGKNYSTVYQKEHPEGFRWLHESFGSNYRMTEMQAAIGRIQLKKMYEWHKKRLINANLIWNAARKCKILRAPIVPKYIDHAAYKCYVFVNGDSDLRDKIMLEINNKGVPCYSGSCSEVYLEKAFDDTSFRPKKRLSVAKELGETSLMFLVHPTLTQDQVMKTCEVLTEVASGYIQN